MHSFYFPYLDPLNLVCFTYCCNDPHQHVLYCMLWEPFCSAFEEKKWQSSLQGPCAYREIKDDYSSRRDIKCSYNTIRAEKRLFSELIPCCAELVRAFLLFPAHSWKIDNGTTFPSSSRDCIL
jgi:hypothetical protein